MSRFVNSVHVKILEGGTKPSKAHVTDAGYDLYSSEDTVIKPGQRQTIKTGISLEMPRHLSGLIWPRSGLAVKQGIDVLAGVIDAGYRGEIMVCLLNTSPLDVTIDKGDRIAQLIFQEVLNISLMVSDELSASQRGGNGFGSSGK